VNQSRRDGGPDDERALRPARSETLTPGIPLDQIGETLASFYDSLISEGLPEHLAGLVHRVRQQGASPAAGEGCARAAPTGTRLALVVEDDADLRALAESLLSETELEPVTCDSAEAALGVLQARVTTSSSSSPTCGSPARWTGSSSPTPSRPCGRRRGSS